MANKLYDENAVKAVADAIRSKNGSSDKYKLADMPQAIANINSTTMGGYWDYLSIFKISFNAEIDVLDVNVPKYCTSLELSFTGSYHIRPKYKTVILSKPDEAEYPITSLAGMFDYNTTVTELYLNIDTSKVTKFNGMLHPNYTKMESIYGEIDCSSVTTSVINGFNGNELITITFKPETIKKSIYFKVASNLSDESVQSIINGLAPTETALTLTLHSNVKERLTEEQIAAINEKGWTLA